MSTSTSEELDALFRRWLSDPAALEPLVDSSVKLLNAIINRKLRGAASTHDVEDVCSEALLELLARLDKSPRDIQDFPAYLARIGYHSVHDYFRRRHPERHKLKNRLRYALKSEYGFALWDAGDAGWLASLDKYRLATPVRVPEDPAPATGPVAEIAAQLLRSAQAPVSFDALVDRLAQILGVHDQQVPLEDLPASVAAPSVDFAASWVPHLERLLAVLATLPVAQRAALLLNLRSAEGESPIHVFVAFGITSIAKLAVLLELESLELARLWKRLPLADQEIAQRLGVTRQQVINLRMSARKRLARNLPEVIKHLK